MEEKDRDRLLKEYNRLEQWLMRLERMKDPETIDSIFFIPEEAQELENLIQRGNKRLYKIGKRLGLPEGPGLPWFQFYDMIVDSIKQYLPAKYQDYEVQIKMVEMDGHKVDVVKLWKEDSPKLPVLQIKEYVDQVENGADGYRVLGRMANDYKKLIHPEKKYQRDR